MKGKTLTITVTPETAIGCLDAFSQVAKIDLQNRSIETITALCLEGFITQMRKNGHILPITEEDAVRRLAIYEAGSNRHKMPTFNDIELTFNREQTGLPHIDRPAPVYHDIEQAVDKMKNQGVEVPIEVNENPEPEVREKISAKESLLTLERDSLEILLLSVGKDDDLIKQAAHEGGNFQTALEIVYTKIPTMLWGSEKARELIENVKKELDTD